LIQKYTKGFVVRLKYKKVLLDKQINRTHAELIKKWIACQTDAAIKIQYNFRKYLKLKRYLEYIENHTDSLLTSVEATPQETSRIKMDQFPKIKVMNASSRSTSNNLLKPKVRGPNKQQSVANLIKRNGLVISPE
jgi:hypothetical protein